MIYCYELHKTYMLCRTQYYWKGNKHVAYEIV